MRSKPSLKRKQSVQRVNGKKGDAPDAKAKLAAKSAKPKPNKITRLQRRRDFLIRERDRIAVRQRKVEAALEWTEELIELNQTFRKLDGMAEKQREAEFALDSKEALSLMTGYTNAMTRRICGKSNAYEEERFFLCVEEACPFNDEDFKRLEIERSKSNIAFFSRLAKAVKKSKSAEKDRSYSTLIESFLVQHWAVERDGVPPLCDLSDRKRLEAMEDFMRRKQKHLDGVTADALKQARYRLHLSA